MLSSPLGAEPFDVPARTKDEPVLPAVRLKPRADPLQAGEHRTLGHEQNPRPVDVGKLRQPRIDAWQVGRRVDHEFDLIGIIGSSAGG